MRRLSCFIVIGLLSVAMGSAQTIVFDNMPGDQYQTGYGKTISGIYSTVGTDWDQGSGFMPSQSGYLTDVWVAMGHVTGPNEFELWLMDDNGGQPGNVLESWYFINQMGSFGSQNPPVHGVGNGGTWLDSSTDYWLIASSHDQTWAAWCYNIIGDQGPNAWRQNLGAWSIGAGDRAAFRIGIPEPATIGWLLGLVALLRRR